MITSNNIHVVLVREDIGRQQSIAVLFKLPEGLFKANVDQSKS